MQLVGVHCYNINFFAHNSSNGKIVKVHKMRMNLSALDVNLRKTMLQIL